MSEQLAQQEEVEAAERQVGCTLAGKYRLERVLGVGGMGAVYEAQNLLLQRPVAIKLVTGTRATRRSARTRMQREAQAAASIRHPNILDVLDVCFDEDGSLFLVTELLHGEPLDHYLATRGALSVVHALELMLPVLGAIAAAHRKNVIHRDLKPGNLFLHTNEAGTPLVKVIDFGISKIAVDVDISKTRTGQVLGTPAYMSPEQARGDAGIDSLSDVWALGVVFFEALTGKLPFDGHSPQMLMIRVGTAQSAPSLTAAAPHLPPALCSIIEGMLHPTKSLRTPSVIEVVRQLLEFADGWPETQGFRERFRSVLPRLDGSSGDPDTSLRLSLPNVLATTIDAPLTPPPDNRDSEPSLPPSADTSALSTIPPAPPVPSEPPGRTTEVGWQLGARKTGAHRSLRTVLFVGLGVLGPLLVWRVLDRRNAATTSSGAVRATAAARPAPATAPPPARLALPEAPPIVLAPAPAAPAVVAPAAAEQPAQPRAERVAAPRASRTLGSSAPPPVEEPLPPQRRSASASSGVAGSSGTQRNIHLHRSLDD